MALEVIQPIDSISDGPPIVAPPKPAITTVLGVAVGDLAAAPCICAVRYDSAVIRTGDPMFGEFPIFETHYTVLGTEELQAGTPIPLLAHRVNTLARRLYDRDSRGDYHVLIDASEAGRPVVDAIRDSVIPQACVTAVTVSKGESGDASILWREETSVGLRYLVSRLQAILQGARLHAAAPRLFDLLRDYDIETAASPDLIRALALACASEYQAVRYGQSPDSLPSPRL